MKLSLSKINFNLIASTLVLLAVGWPITVLTNVKIHYFYFLFATIVLFVLNPFKKNLPFVALYCFLFFIVFLYHLFEMGPETSLLLSSATYIVIPFVYSRNLITSDDLIKILNALSFITLFNLVGVVLQLQGIGTGSELLKPDMALTEGVYHPRYTGFSGGSLALGVLSCTTLFAGLYHLLITKKRIRYNTLITVVSVICLLFSFSRRFYVFGMVGTLVILYIWLKNKKITLNTYLLLMIIILISVVVLIIVLAKSETIAERLTSIVNFSSDNANIGRLTRWEHAFTLFKKNAFMGLSPGITGTVGRENVTNATVFSAESYYLKILLETGLVVSLVYIIFLIYMVRRSLRSLRNTSLAIPITLFTFYGIESFISTSLESPFSAILLWISLALIYNTRLDHDLKDEVELEAITG